MSYHVGIIHAYCGSDYRQLRFANNIKSTLQVANVTRPLLAVSKICANGLNVLYKKDHALILDVHDKVVGRFDQRNGLYVATVQVKNPKCPGFHGQDR